MIGHRTSKFHNGLPYLNPTDDTLYLNGDDVMVIAEDIDSYHAVEPRSPRAAGRPCPHATGAPAGIFHRLAAVERRVFVIRAALSVQRELVRRPWRGADTRD